MKHEDFQRLLTKSTKHTKNVRACSKEWYSGVCKIDDKIASEIGSIVLLLQEKIDNGYFCGKDSYLMIYNFQPLHISTEVYLCSLDIVIRPLAKINDLDTCEGTRLNLVVDGKNGTVINNFYAMKMMGIYDEEEEQGVSETYGSYIDFREPKATSFKERLNALEINNLGSTVVDRAIKIDKKELKDHHDGTVHSSKLLQDTQKMVTFAYGISSFCEPSSPLTPTQVLKVIMDENSAKNSILNISSPISCTV